MKGSITIFLAGLLLVVLLLAMVLLEGARIEGTKSLAKEQDHLAATAVFAEYDTKLLERYHIFGLDMTYQTKRPQLAKLDKSIKKYAKTHASEGFVLDSEIEECQVTGYQTLDDDSGAAFVSQAISYEKYRVAEKTLQRIKNMIDGEGAAETGESSLSDYVEASEKALAEASKPLDYEAEDKTSVSAVSGGVTKEDALSIYEGVKELAQKGVLWLVLDTEESVSEKSLTQREHTNENAKRVSLLLTEYPKGIDNQIVFGEYLLENFGSYRNEKDENVLSYELEYVLFGKSSDQNNLKAMVNQLLLTREGVNISYLITDASKVAEAEEVALALAGVTANPAVVEAVKAVILAGWAFAESVYDVRALMRGKKVVALKSKDTWHCQLATLGKSMKESQKDSISNGLNYEDYLRIFLLAKKMKRTSERSLDLIEGNMRKEDGHENFQTCYCISGAEISINRSVGRRFLAVSRRKFSNYQIIDNILYQYQ